MVSILIPVYNSDISSLVEEIHKQANNAKITFEIICLEDGSDKFTLENKLCLENLSHSSVLISKTNNGRTDSRQILANSAAYNWLLFLDADVIPKHDIFIEKYISQIPAGFEAFYGGITYKNTKPKSEYILRWKYGMKNEKISAIKRNMKPYKNIVSANFLIKKQIFINLSSKIKKDSYGLDNYFGALLKQNNIKISHLDNEVYHLGIEKSEVYLKKVEEASKTLLWLVNKKSVVNQDNGLLAVFIFLKRYKINYLVSLFFKIFNSFFRKNLLGKNPSMFLLQLHKLSYMCYKDLN